MREKYNKGNNNIGYIIKSINVLLDNGKVDLARKEVNKVLQYVKEEKGLILCEARIAIFDGKYQEALNYLDCINEDYNYCYFRKAMLYLILKDDENIKRIYNKYFVVSEFVDKGNNKAKFNYLKYSIMGYLGFPINNEWEILSYRCKQAYAYSDERAIDHIENRHSYADSNDYDEETDGLNSFFSNDIDINQLFYDVKRAVNDNPDKCIFKYGYSIEFIYLIHYPYCVSDIQGEQKNYIFVVTDINKNIITMFPNYEILNLPVIEINRELDDNKINNDKVLVRRKSNIDKFKEKYNM